MPIVKMRFSQFSQNRRNIVWTLYVVEDEKLCFNFIAMMLSTNDRILMGVEKSKKKKSGKRGGGVIN